MHEARAFVKTWWCRGGGAATLLLLAVVSIFRAPRDVIFWIAVSFFVAHTALAVRRYRIERKARATATVLRHHQTHSSHQRYRGIVFTPPPANSLLVPIKVSMKTLPQQTKNPF